MLITPKAKINNIKGHILVLSYNRQLLRINSIGCNLGPLNSLNRISKHASKNDNTKGYFCEIFLKIENKFMNSICLVRTHLLILVLFLIYLQATIAIPAGHELFAQSQDLDRRYYNSTYSGPTAQASKNSTRFPGSNLSSYSGTNSTMVPTFTFSIRPLTESTNTFSATPTTPSFIYNPFEESQSRVVRLDKNSIMLESTTSYALNHTKDLTLLTGANPAQGGESYLDLFSPWFPSVPAVYCKGTFKLIIEGKISPIPGRDATVAPPSNKEIRIEITSSDKLPLGEVTSNKRAISGNVTISNNLTHNSEDDEYDQWVSNNNNLQISRVFNNCQTLAYSK